MKTLYRFICENDKEKGTVLQELDDALKYFEEDEYLKKAGFTREMIEYLYTYTNEHSLKSPFVKNHKGEKGFVVRRWLNDTPEINKYLLDNGFDPSKNIKNIYNGPHNTRLEKINEFPNSTQYEYFIAMSLNVKTLGKNNTEDALKYAMFGENKKLNNNELGLFKKYKNYYNDHKSEINALSEGYYVEKGELFKKLPNSSTKSHISDDWIENGQYKRYPNYTPKTDIISNHGRQISVKNGNGSQAMSGGENEARATLMSYKYLLDNENQKDIDSLFEHNWKGRNKDRNNKLNSIIKKIFGG